MKLTKNQLHCFGAFVVVSFSHLAHAQTTEFESKPWTETARPYLGIGSLGITLGSAFEASESVDARISYSSLRYKKTDNSSSSTTSTIDLNNSNLSLLADWFPSNNSGWRLTGGLQTGSNKITLSAKPTGSVTIGGNTYNNVNFSAALDLGSTAPYLGLGYSTRESKGSGLTFFNDIGVRFGTAKVNLSESTGAVSQADLNAEKVKIENKVKSLRYYPVVGFSLGYRW